MASPVRQFATIGTGPDEATTAGQQERQEGHAVHSVHAAHTMDTGTNMGTDAMDFGDLVSTGTSPVSFLLSNMNDMGTDPIEGEFI